MCWGTGQGCKRMRLEKQPVTGLWEVVYVTLGAPQVSQGWRIHLAMRETHKRQVRFLGEEDPLLKEMAPHSSILAWETPWREEPGGRQEIGLQRVWHDWAHTHTYTTLNVYSGDQSTVDGVMCGKVSSFWKMTLLVMQIIWGMCKRESVKSLSCVWLFAIPWTVAHQVPRSMEFSR